jgi:hypothetical protein
MTTTPHLSLPLIAAAQAQKHVTHNEALLAVDALLHCAAKDKDLAAPPAAPAEGDRYIVAAAPTGAWAGKAGQVATRQDGAWRFYAPQAGWIAFVIDEMQLYHFNGTAWAPGVLATLQNLALLGLGTTADAANPFSAKVNAALQAAKTVAEGGTGDVRMKLSKESTAKTASCVFQTNFSGRAELGLAGDDNFRVKTSADGSTWVDALVLAAATGQATFGAGASFAGAVTAASTATIASTLVANGGFVVPAGVSCAWHTAGVFDYQMYGAGGTAVHMSNDHRFYAPSAASLFASITAGGLTVGNGATVQKFLSAVAALDFPSIAANGGTQDLTIALAGAAANDAVSLGLATAPPAGVVFEAFVSAANVVTVRATNCTAGAINPASQNFRVTIAKV